MNNTDVMVLVKSLLEDWWSVWNREWDGPSEYDVLEDFKDVPNEALREVLATSSDLGHLQVAVYVLVARWDAEALPLIRPHRWAEDAWLREVAMVGCDRFDPSITRWDDIFRAIRVQAEVNIMRNINELWKVLAKHHRKQSKRKCRAGQLNLF